MSGVGPETLHFWQNPSCCWCCWSGPFFEYQRYRPLILISSNTLLMRGQDDQDRLPSQAHILTPAKNLSTFFFVLVQNTPGVNNRIVPSLKAITLFNLSRWFLKTSFLPQLSIKATVFFRNRLPLDCAFRIRVLEILAHFYIIVDRLM